MFLFDFRDLLGYNCRIFIVYNIMLLILIFTPTFSNPLSDINEVGARIQFHTE